jgi:AcrR family transcriptional regulator
VRAALINAGARLFTERGIRAVSIRELARSAGVNHGLIHRHFGSKAGLLEAVMAHLANQVGTALGPPAEDERLVDILQAALGATRSQGVHWRLMARALLDGEDPATLQQEFPVVARMMAAARREPIEGIGPEARVTALLALTLGMLLFTPYLRLATGQSDESWQETRRAVMGFAFRALVDG